MLTTNFTMHHGPKSTKSTRREDNFVHQIYSLKSLAQFGLPICAVRVLVQHISERLTSPIAGLGGCCKDHVFFFFRTEKDMQALQENNCSNNTDLLFGAHEGVFASS